VGEADEGRRQGSHGSCGTALPLRNQPTQAVKSLQQLVIVIGDCNLENAMGHPCAFDAGHRRSFDVGSRLLQLGEETILEALAIPGRTAAADRIQIAGEASLTSVPSHGQCLTQQPGQAPSHHGSYAIPLYQPVPQPPQARSGGQGSDETRRCLLVALDQCIL